MTYFSQQPWERHITDFHQKINPEFKSYTIAAHAVIVKHAPFDNMATSDIVRFVDLYQKQQTM